MGKRKAKREDKRSEPHSDGREFWGMWIFSQTVMLTLLWLLLGSYERLASPFHSISTFITSFVLILAFMLAATTLQQLTAERFFKFSMKGWAFASGFGTALSLVAYVIAHPMGLFASAIAMFMPTALMQMLWIRPDIFFAWLWPLAHLVGIVLFVETWLPQRDWATLLLAPIQAIIYTIVMRHLFARSYNRDTQKTDVAAKETVDQAHVQQMEDSEIHGTFEVSGDDQIAQYEAR